MVFKKMQNWISGGKTRKPGNVRRLRKQSSLALEALESRVVMSATSATDSDVLFRTLDQNMWTTGSAYKITESFTESLLDVDFGTSFGGFGKKGKTGLKASFAAGFDLAVRGEFSVTGGEVDVDYQTDFTVSALTSAGVPATNLAAGDHFILRAQESPDPAAINMETEFANIGAGLFLDYGLYANGSLHGKLFGKTLVNTGFNKSHNGSLELIGAELNLGTGTGEARTLGGSDPGETFKLEDRLTFDAAKGIVMGEFYIPALNTGVAGDEYEDSTWNGEKIVNAHLPIDRSGGRTRIDFFRLGIGIDELITKITKVPMQLPEIGGKAANVNVTLLNADLEAYLGLAQEMTFDPTVWVDYNFLDGSGNPLYVSVETAPGSGVYQAVTTKRVALGQDLGVIHQGGDMNIDTDYVLSGQFHNKTSVYLSPAFTLDVGKVDIDGSLVKLAQKLNILPDDMSFSLYSNTFALGNPIKIATLFNQGFDIGGFSEVDGTDLSVYATPPPALQVTAQAQNSTINEGETLFLAGTIFDEAGANDGSDVYNLTIDWKNGAAPQVVTLDANTTGTPNGVTYDTTTGTFSVSHRYTDDIGAQTISVSATHADSLRQVTGADVSVTVNNVAPTLNIDPIEIDANGNATLTGSYVDPGINDDMQFRVDWGTSLFLVPWINIPAVSNNPMGQTYFVGSGGVLTVTSQNPETGEITFKITDKSYAGKSILNSLKVELKDKESEAAPSITQPIPWGLSTSVLNSSVRNISEDGTAKVDIQMTEYTRTMISDWSLTKAPLHFQVSVDWQDPNRPEVTTFYIQVRFGTDEENYAPSWTVSDNPENYIPKNTINGTTLTVEGVDMGTDENGHYASPRIRLSRSFLDDGRNDGTPVDVSNAKITIFSERDGAFLETPITINNVAPTLTLDPTETVGIGGVAILNGTITDPGKLDSFALQVNWGDGSTYDNDWDAATPDDPFQLFTFDANESGSQPIQLFHKYEDLTANSYTVTATLIDDDGQSNTATGSYTVKNDHVPVAFDDFFTTTANQVLNFNVLNDNDTDPDTPGDIDPEDQLNPNVTAIVPGSVNPASAAAHITNNGDGTFSFDPTVLYGSLPNGESAVVEFRYRIEDMAGLSDTGLVRIVVNPTLVYTVSTTVDESDGDYSPGDLSLREAIELTNQIPGNNIITFDPTVFSTPQTISLTEGHLDITDSLTINGTGADRLTISGNSSSGILHFSDHSQSTLTVNDVTLADASGGSAIEVLGNDQTVLNINRSVLKDNTLLNDSSLSTDAGSVTITDSAIVNNFSVYQSVLAFGNTDVTISNTTISDNSSANSVLYVYDTTSNSANASLSLNHVTIANNGGGGVYAVSLEGNLDVSYRNSIFSNPAGLDFQTYSGSPGTVTLTSLGNNIISDSTGDATPESSDLVNTDPKLGANLEPIRATYAYRLLWDSPAIDAANDAYSPAADQIGQVRNDGAYDGNVRADIGAYEAQPLTIIVDSTADESDGDHSAGDLTLREAIELSNSTPEAETIVFDPTVFASAQTITLTNGELSITDDVKIEGTGAKLLTIDAGGQSRILSVNDGNDSNHLNVILEGMTFTGGDSNTTGGAITNRENLTVKSMALSGNSAASTGGAIDHAIGTLTVTGSTVDHNTAPYGGGINSVYTTLRIDSSTFSNNTATFGGAIGNGGGTLIINNSTIALNSANYAGGINSWQGNTSLVSTIVADNTAPSYADIRNEQGTFSTAYSLIENNGDQVTSTGDSFFLVDPMLDPNGLQDNGGPTKTIALLPGSPALNLGSNPEGFLTDQRGTGFDRTMSGHPDIGAFEYGATGTYTGQTLNGTSGHDMLTGGNGNDTLTGGIGDDYLTGGLGSDRFVFAPETSGGTPVSFGTDYITDFNEAENDKLDLTAMGFASYADFLSQATVTELDLDEDGLPESGLRIDFGDGNIIKILDLALADLDENDLLL